ncbi:hypothetical protein ABVB72_17890 [Rhizobium nepotum]|uniref:hypothetical protein n=1 Tax=Rhizobium nepotum TaxID=1035271 RepID=UPI00336A1B1E
MRSTSVSPDCLSRSTEAGPSSRSWPAVAIDQAAQDVEHIPQMVNLIRDDQPVIRTCRIGIRFRQSGPVCLRFQNEMDGGQAFANIDGWRRLPA